MKYSPAFTATARAARAHTAAQDWIANKAPVLEQRLKRAALKALIARGEAALNFIDYTLPIWILTIQLFCVKCDRAFIRQLIKVHQFNETHGLTAKASKAWASRGVIATNALDRVFCLTD